MNFPGSLAFKISSPVCVIRGSVSDIEESLADNGNDEGLRGAQFSA
jgi:hypothetical protein